MYKEIEVKWDDLTDEQKYNVRCTVISYFDSWAYDGDEWDEERCQEIINSEEEQIEFIKSCRGLYLQEDGYIYVDV